MLWDRRTQRPHRRRRARRRRPRLRRRAEARRAAGLEAQLCALRAEQDGLRSAAEDAGTKIAAAQAARGPRRPRGAPVSKIAFSDSNGVI